MGLNCLLPTAWTDIPIKSRMMIYGPTVFQGPSNRCGAGRLLVYNTLAAAPAPSNDEYIHALLLYLFAPAKGFWDIRIGGFSSNYKRPKEWWRFHSNRNVKLVA